MKSYLIQRCTTRTFTKKQFNSIDEMLDYDYMGNSEYEWGALPRSYKRIRFNFGKYKVFNTGLKNCNGVPCFVLCQESKKDLVIENIKELAQGERRLKEGITFQHHIKKSEYLWNKPRENFWWDIENDFMLWFGEDKNDVIFNLIAKSSVEFLNSLKKYKIKYGNGLEEITKGEELDYQIRIYREDGTIQELHKGRIEYEETVA